LRQEISDLCEYGEGFNFDICYKLPVNERKLQLMMLKRKLEETASKADTNSLQLNENSSMSQIKSLAQKFDKKSHEYSTPKK
jgi:hypothetical protein